MNTEETIKQKQYEKKVCLDGAAYHQSLVQEFETKAQNIEKEIASLSKSEEPRALSFLELAFKYEKDLWVQLDILMKGNIHITVYEAFANEMHNDYSIPLEQCKKFVAEIYLTLLAKELNGDWVADYRDENQIKQVPIWNYVRNKLDFETTYNLQTGNIVFSEPTISLALTYSEEATTMFNWYFGREKGK
jgi:hypothetical protein